jgi:choloylglycine hydrolase
MDPPTILPATSLACTSFCLDNGDHCVFGANLDNRIDIGLLFVNKRGVSKTGWEPGTAGDYARWTSRYGSVVFGYAGYQQAWAGMNEAGLMVSTMALSKTRAPAPDTRPPLLSPFWIQYLLDCCGTVEEVIASEARVRVTDIVDHYLICDRTGACATLEFLGGRLIYHTGQDLPVKALTNTAYQEAVRSWQTGSLSGDSLRRFAQAADRVQSFAPTNAQGAVNYAFDTLASVARDDTAWRIVFDPAQLRIHFRTSKNPQLRSVDFAQLDFSCGSPVMLLDVQADWVGDVSAKFAPYSHKASLDHTLRFMEQYGRSDDYPPVVLDVLLRGLESFACANDPVDATAGQLVSYRPLTPPIVSWVGLTILRYAWPVWLALTALSLVVVIWHSARDSRFSWNVWLAWALAAALFGPFGLLAYVLTARKRRQVEAHQ